jgi:hypothetical protein
MRLIGIVLLLLMVQSCSLLSRSEKKSLRQKNSCERKFERYAKKCGTTVDTVYVPITIELDSQYVSKNFSTNQDTTTIDSLLRRLEIAYTSVGSDSDDTHTDDPTTIYRNIIRYVKNKRCIDGIFRIDTTITIMIDGSPAPMRIFAEISQPDGQTINGKIGVPDQEFNSTKEITTTTIAPPVFTWKEQIYKAWKPIGIGLVIIIILYLLLRFIWKVVKNFIR